MSKSKLLKRMLPAYILILTVFLFAVLGGNRAITALSENAPIEGRKCVVIDAGHGGEDGGATSCTGVNESNINLDICLRLDDLMHLLGIDTKMIRNADRSVYTKGNTIAQKKVSDLKERVRIVNNTPNAVLLSIHQNYFEQERYSGAQVFYAQTADSKFLAEKLQDALKTAIDNHNNRSVKKADGIYLMQHVSVPAVLVECGFLSNYSEETKLRDPAYQKKLCCVIASVYSGYLNDC